MGWQAAGAGANIAAGLANYAIQSSANDRAEAMQNENMQKWLALNIPDPAQQKIVLEKFISQGKIDPVFQQAIQQSPSEFSKIVSNPTYQAAQDRALGELQDIGESGGLRLQDKEALQEAQIQSQTQDRAARQGISAEMARRGLGGSGFDVAAQLQGQQAQGDRDANSSLRIASDAQKRALDAIQSEGGLATQYRTQDFGEKSAKASAADRINQFNTANSRDVNAANVTAQNQAKEFNLRNDQDVANKNTSATNQNSMYNAGLLQQQYENQQQKLKGVTGANSDLAQTAIRGGQIAGNAVSNAGSAVSGAASAQGQGDILDAYLKEQEKRQKGYTGGSTIA